MWFCVCGQFGRQLGAYDVSALLAGVSRVVDLECSACSRQGHIGASNREYSDKSFLPRKYENLDPMDSEVIIYSIRSIITIFQIYMFIFSPIDLHTKLDVSVCMQIYLETYLWSSIIVKKGKVINLLRECTRSCFLQMC